MLSLSYTSDDRVRYLIAHDVDQRRGPFSTIHVLELLQQNLNGLPVGRAHREEV